MTTAKKKSYEGLILEQFVQHLGQEWEVVDQPDPTPPKADEEAPRPPDGVLTSPSGDRVYVELVSYLVPGENLELHTPDEDVKRAVDAAWMSTPDIQELSVRLDYAREQGRFKVPKPNGRARFVEQLIALVRDPLIPKVELKLVVLRGGAEVPDCVDGTPEHPRVVTTRYPGLARYLTSVEISHHPGLRCLLSRTSLNTMWGGVAGDHIRTQAKKKLGKEYVRVPHFRPLWLVMHADGVPMHTFLGPEEVQGAIEIARGEFTAHKGPNFDRVYLFNRAATTEPELHEVWRQDTQSTTLP